MKIWAIDQEKVLVTHGPWRTWLYEDLLQLNNEKTNNRFEKWEQDLNRHFNREATRRAGAHVGG